MRVNDITLQRVAADSLSLPGFEYFDGAVQQIVEQVRIGGDNALAAIAGRLGDPPPRRVSEDEIALAYAGTPSNVREALHAAAKRIETFAQAQRDALKNVKVNVGNLEVGHRIVAIERVGLYVPGGRHPLPSSLLMCVIPARVAGVKTMAVCTPNMTPPTLAAAHIAGVTELYELGGAHAIAALAYGTESIRRVDLIAGPGNAYVTAAKRLVLGVCGIDALAGPSEIVVIASDDADARLVALDLLAQAEHDPRASAILLTDDCGFAHAVDGHLTRELESLATAQVAQASIERNGRCAVLPLEDAATTCNRLAPEHVALHGFRAGRLVEALETYGSLFVGDHAAEVFGDYGDGPNHVLPTSGSARFASGLSVYTFLATRTYHRAHGALPREVIEQTATLAFVEGLHAHRHAALAR